MTITPRAKVTSGTSLGASGSVRSPWGLIAVLAACGLVMTLQQSLVLPVLPSLPALLGTSASNASWLVTATLVTGAVATPLLSRLADLFGKRRMITIILAVVIAASLLGALSDALGPLLIARDFQGCGLALVPIAIATMRDVLPPAQLPSGIAAMTASLAVGPAPDYRSAAPLSLFWTGTGSFGSP